MKVDLKLRYQSFEEVHKDLDTYLGHLAAPTARVRRAEPVTRPEVRESDLRGRPRRTSSNAPCPTRIEGQKTVLCVEAQDEIREAFRRTLTKMGYRVLLVSSAELAAERYREGMPDAVVFDVDGLGPDALNSFLDMHEAAHEDGRDLAAIVLLGPRQHYLAKNLPTDDRLVVLPKPIKMKQVQDAIAELVPMAGAGG